MKETTFFSAPACDRRGMELNDCMGDPLDYEIISEMLQREAETGHSAWCRDEDHGHEGTCLDQLIRRVQPLLEGEQIDGKVDG
jgi:hypothetical protein